MFTDVTSKHGQLPGLSGRFRRFLSKSVLAATLLSTAGQPVLAQPGQFGFGPSFGTPAPLPAAVSDQTAPLAVPLTSGHMIPVQPVQHTRRDSPRAHDSRIESMPDDYKKMDVIHHRSQLVITRQPVKRFAITDPGVIEIVQYSPTEFSIIGNGLGTTDMMMWFEGQDLPLMYLVTVIRDPDAEDRRRSDFGKIERKLAALYPNSKVYLIPMSRKIIVRGQARDAREAANIMNIVRGEVLTPDGGLYNGSNLINGVGGPTGPNVDVGLLTADANGAIGGLGQLSSLIVNELSVPGEHQLQIRVRIAEVNRSMLREYGFDWNAFQVQFGNNNVNATSNLGGGGNLGLTGLIDNVSINAAMQALAQNGTIRIMEDAALTVLSGESAAFLSGGEFAVPTQVGFGNGGAVSTTFRGFGTSVIATPTLVDNDLIRMQVVPELSQISGVNTVGGIPGLNVRRVQTRVELREGQTIVLGGLYSRQTSASQSRIPLLGELPIIGPAFFQSKRATEDEIETLILVTPEIVRAMDPDQVPPLPGHYVTHPDDVDFYKLGRTEGNPNLGHYQLLPYGNGQGVGQDVGYNFFNPAPQDGQLAPMPTGAYTPGQYGGNYDGGYPPQPNYGGYAPQPGYSGDYGGQPGYGVQPGYGYAPQPTYAPQPNYGPVPTPATTQSQWQRQPVQQVSGTQPTRGQMPQQIRRR